MNNQPHLATSHWTNVVRKRGWLPMIMLGTLMAAPGCVSTRYTGCSGVLTTNCLTGLKAQRQANKIWKAKYAQCYCSRSNAKDIKLGFIDGFLSVAMGGSGCPPLVAPASTCGRTIDGHRWYEGFPLGATAAESSLCRQEVVISPQLLACLAQLEDTCEPGCIPCQSGAVISSPQPLYQEGMLDSEPMVIPSPMGDEPNPFSEVPEPEPAADAAGADASAESESGNAEAPALPEPEDAPPAPAPEPLKDAIEGLKADPKSPSDVSQAAPISPIRSADPMEQKGKSPVVTGPVEMPNLQVAYEVDDKDWLFNEVDTAKALFRN